MEIDTFPRLCLKNKKLIEAIDKAKALFFDLDGTLIDTEPLYFYFWKKAIESFGVTPKYEDVLAMRSLDVTLAKEHLKTIDPKLDYDIVKKVRISLMTEYLNAYEIKVKDYVFDVLNKYKDKKDMYIVTANTVEKANRILEMTKLSPYFKGVISAKDTKRGKPFPYVYLYASKYVNLNPKDILTFEDSPNGIRSAHEAGNKVVYVLDMTYPTDEDKKFYDYLLVEWNEIL